MTRALKPLPVLTFEIPEGIRFAKVEPGTGLLASDSSQKTTTEVFAAGTEPTKPPPPKANPLRFYELDQLNPFTSTGPSTQY